MPPKKKKRSRAEALVVLLFCAPIALFAGRETARPRGLRGFFARPARPRTDVAAAADHLGKVLKRRSEVVLISDGGEQILGAGDTAGFAAAAGDGQHLVNKG